MNGKSIVTLLDSGATGCFLADGLARALKLKTNSCESPIRLASRNTSARTIGSAKVNLELKGVSYFISVEIVPDLCVPLILGQSFFNLHEEFSFEQEGMLPHLRISAEDTCFVAAVEPPVIFSTPENCKPIATPSRRYSEDDQTFINTKISRLLEQGIIEPSRSSWRAQVLVARSSAGKRRMVVDYSRTINRYTPLDAYPLPRIDEQVNNIAKGTVFSTLDLRSAYQQIPLHPDDRQFTAFEASGKLYQLSSSIRTN